MALFLHLSDLHLGTTKEGDIPDDFKTDVIPLEDRPTRQLILKETLTQLAKQLKEQNEHLDAIIISGDVTVANDEVGFQKLEEVLSWLGDRRPSPEKIVVVPGNHDVKWESTGGPAQKYELFLRYTRAKGFVTPLLEGIDLKSGQIVGADLTKYYLADRDYKWAIVPLNSSDLCGSLEPLTTIPETVWTNLADDIVAKSPDLNREAVAKELRRLRLRDIARISDPDQMLAIKTIAADIRTRAGDNKPVLIAVIHHHLLPVSVREELKPFESITNLGHFRSVLQDNNYSAILHGHKHTGYCYFDYIHKLPEADVGSPHRIFVISAPSVEAPGGRPTIMCRLIRISGGQTAPTLSLQDVPSVETGKTLQVEAKKSFRLWQACSADSLKSSPIHLVEGNSIDEVYERTLALFEGRSTAQIPNVICRVAETSDPVSLPAQYPPVKDVPDAERASWFAKLVDWWQKDDFKKLSGDRHFNHGHRIHRYERGVNQFDRVAEAIMLTCKTSRGIVTLLKPQIDELQNHSRRFPSFCLVQFLLRDCGDQYNLEVIAYFRKQEMRFWWPVNIAELAKLQRKIFNRVQSTVEDREKKAVTLGVITTFAASALLGTTVPSILTQAVDVDLEETPQKLWDMTYALCWVGMRDREKQVVTWERVLRDLIPPVPHDPAGVLVPIQGVGYLAEIAEHFARNHGGDVTAIASRWRELERRNLDYAKRIDETQGRIPPEEHQNWRNDVVAKLEEIQAIIERVFGVSLQSLR